MLVQRLFHVKSTVDTYQDDVVQLRKSKVPPLVAESDFSRNSAAPITVTTVSPISRHDYLLNVKSSHRKYMKDNS